MCTQAVPSGCFGIFAFPFFMHWFSFVNICNWHFHMLIFFYICPRFKFNTFFKIMKRPAPANIPWHLPDRCSGCFGMFRDISGWFGIFRDVHDFKLTLRLAKLTKLAPLDASKRMHTNPKRTLNVDQHLTNDTSGCFGIFDLFWCDTCKIWYLIYRNGL